MLKKWDAEYKTTKKDREQMLQAVTMDLTGAEAGDHTVLVGGDTLLYATIVEDGTIHVYETRITASTENSQEQTDEGEAAINLQKAGGLLS